MYRYKCLNCKRTKTVEAKDNTPEYCGRPMKKIPIEICLQPAYAEYARSMELDESCDDFRAG